MVLVPEPLQALGQDDLHLLAKIDQNSRQNFILRGRFPRESCRSRRDLQLSLGNLGLRMKFCLKIWLQNIPDIIGFVELMKVSRRRDVGEIGSR